MNMTNCKESRTIEYKVQNTLLNDYKINKKNKESSIIETPKNRSFSINKSFNNVNSSLTHHRSQSRVMQTLQEMK
jgi:hypothetical protein